MAYEIRVIAEDKKRLCHDCLDDLKKGKSAATIDYVTVASPITNEVRTHYCLRCAKDQVKSIKRQAVKYYNGKLKEIEKGGK